MIGKPGSPNRRESQGDGVSIVVRGWESQPHGEGRQVDRMTAPRGTRDANCRNDAGHHRRSRQACESCHHAIHAGKLTRERAKIDEVGSLESRILGNG